MLFSYVSKKLAGAGFSISIFFSIWLLVCGFDWFEWSEQLTGWIIWAIFFGYGPACSILIDVLACKLQGFGRFLVKCSLYAAAGFGLFMVKGLTVYSLLAGIIGAVAALTFYYGTFLAAQGRFHPYFCAFALPLIFLLLINIDFTQKTGWTETQTPSGVTVSFDYFHGKHKIPITLKAEQNVAFTIKFKTASGGYGFHVHDSKNQLVGLQNHHGSYRFTAVHEGEYKIIITGNRLRGEAEVAWTLGD